MKARRSTGKKEAHKEQKIAKSSMMSPACCFSLVSAVAVVAMEEAKRGNRCTIIPRTKGTLANNPVYKPMTPSELYLLPA